MSADRTAPGMIAYLSGGTDNTDPEKSLGGPISKHRVKNNALHNIFKRVPGQQGGTGSSNSLDLRGVYVKNETGRTVTDVIGYFYEDPAYPAYEDDGTPRTPPETVDVRYNNQMTVAKAFINPDTGAMFTTTDPNRVSLTFASRQGFYNRLTLADKLDPGDSVPLVFRRHVLKGSPPRNSAGFLFGVDADTGDNKVG